MPKKKSVNTPFYKVTNVIDIILYVSFFAAIIMSIFLEKKQLIYVLPIVIISLLFKYINLTKKKANPIFICAILATLASDVLSFYCFEDCFGGIATLTSIYLICCAFTLKKYLHIEKLRSLPSISVMISIVLISYILFSILKLLVYSIPDNHLFFVFLCALSLIVYTITFAIVYLNDNYNNSPVLLASGLFTFFQVVLVSINEFLYFNSTFTVLIIICHIMAIYLFMNFIVKTKVIKPENIKENFF
ncbi:hypothetical protein [Lacinutrix sp. Bg11-31]|uniref:hypothetical protein n=1 Tax=Lacinutrix sp. Bg11-31 TaxID=2057808 RepID=UPI000C308B67|nr:hypothetical protein [Lacinutrix sp. Bg11-31]AUC81418.1 hypothetical protein CW733_04450 [Lacinutrix sp. Bg11-31]